MSNSVVWLLAFAPLLGLFLEGFFEELTGVSGEPFWWTTLVLNIGLGYWDEARLHRAGHDTSRMGGAWLVPVYLFKRASVLKQSRGYFVVWCILFAVFVL